MFEDSQAHQPLQTFMTRAVATLVLSVVLCTTMQSQTARNMAVLLHARAYEFPKPHVVLQWDSDQGAQVYDVFRKRLGEARFANEALVRLDSAATGWVDSSIVEGDYYEYRVIKQAQRRVGFDTVNQRDLFLVHMATGYAAAGVRAVTPARGRALVLVDETLQDPLADELDSLFTDLGYEGWRPTLKTVPRATTFDGQKVAEVQTLIRTEHSADPLGAILLIGRVPVPYSGDIAPDGHRPDHLGAWPCDGCYGDVDGTYTDAGVTRPNTQRPAQNNVPGDGKWDNSVFASDVDVPVGRIDFYDMPQFAMSEVELLRAYLQKNHRWRIGQVETRWRAVIDDNFGTQSYPESFASSAWRMFAPFVTDTGMRNGDYFGTLSATPQPYLLSYGTGGGTNTSAGGVGTSQDFADSTANSVFTFLFGSYFGDWDTQNNFMRASLASAPQVLSCGWSGRPHWYIHRMAMGGTIGESALLSQNNIAVSSTTGLGPFFPHAYFTSNGWQMAVAGDRGVHIALMGDPTLRLVRSSPPIVVNVRAQTEYPHKVNVTWQAGAVPAEAYQVYRQRGANPNFILLTPKPIQGLAYRDSLVFEGRVQYRIVPLATVYTHSGSILEAGTPKLVSVVTTSVANADASTGLRAQLHPSPAQQYVNVDITSDDEDNLVLTVIDVRGIAMQRLELGRVSAGTFTHTISTSALPSGVYTVRLSGRRVTTGTPLVVAH